MKFSEATYETALDHICRELTGKEWEDARDDESGTYWSSDHWVSSRSICQALREAYDEGHDEGEMDAG